MPQIRRPQEIRTTDKYPKAGEDLPLIRRPQMIGTAEAQEANQATLETNLQPSADEAYKADEALIKEALEDVSRTIPCTIVPNTTRLDKEAVEPRSFIQDYEVTRDTGHSDPELIGDADNPQNGLVQDTDSGRQKSMKIQAVPKCRTLSDGSIEYYIIYEQPARGGIGIYVHQDDLSENEKLQLKNFEPKQLRSKPKRMDSDYDYLAV